MAATQDVLQPEPSFISESALEESALESAADRRAYPRHAVDCPIRITLLAGAGVFSGRLVDLSLGGCLINTENRFSIGIQTRVEVEFQLRGIAFRLAGVSASTRSPHSFAIRFLHVPARRQEELGAVLIEEAAGNAARQAAEAPKPAIAPPLQLLPASIPATPTPVSGASSPKAKEQPPAAAIVAPAPVKSRDRRASSRHAVDTRAKLLLVKTGITMTGRILNLSLGGCQIRMEECFNVGIYVRIEAEFYLHGLPFRVGGVSQAIMDKFTIGIRFLDLSTRRREQLEELMAEIAEWNESRPPAAAYPATPAE